MAPTAGSIEQFIFAGSGADIQKSELVDHLQLQDSRASADFKFKPLCVAASPPHRHGVRYRSCVRRVPPSSVGVRGRGGLIQLCVSAHRIPAE